MGTIPQAVSLTRAWDAELSPLAPDTGDIWERAFYQGRAALMTTHSGNPYWGLAEPEHHPRPFRWGIVPMPRPRRSDPHHAYWYHSAVFVRGTARDPVEAFTAAAAVFTAGPPARGGELPAYRTAETMRTWRADPLPLGRECLLEIEGQARPWSPSLYAVPGIRSLGERMTDGELPVADGIRLIEEAVRAGTGA